MPVALSIRQPHAALILAGVKRIENRSWSTRHRGPLWIHAATTLDVRSWSDVYDFGAGKPLRADEPVITPEGIHLPALADLPRGCIVGRVDVTDCVDLHDLPYDTIATDPDALGPWCWLLGSPVALERPVPCPGGRRLWEVPPAVLAALDAQLQPVARR